MKRTDKKSDCPINYFLEIFGDPWSLLVLRDIVFFGKHTFSEFLCSSERITTNILTNRLMMLESRGIIEKSANAEDKRSGFYSLSEKGLSLIPMLLDMMAWGTAHDDKSAGHRKKDFVQQIRTNREECIQKVTRNVAQGKMAFE